MFVITKTSFIQNYLFSTFNKYFKPSFMLTVGPQKEFFEIIYMYPYNKTSQNKY